MGVLGRVFGGPVLGAIGKWASIRAALIASGWFLMPIVVLYRRGLKLEKREMIVEDSHP